MSRCVGGGGHGSPVTARTLKYMANSAAKNISSDDSHTIVPTLTMLGRVREWIELRSNAGAVVVTGSLWPPHPLRHGRGAAATPAPSTYPEPCLRPRPSCSPTVTRH